jgi:group II intron reverse transcriptase/maturase
MALEAVYEQDFLNCSYGYRPRRSAHQAIQDWNGWMTQAGGGWVIELDIAGFFDHLVHRHLRSFLDQRVRDGVIRRTIHKWLKAGVFEDGEWRQTREGTPQGGVISPLLANIYLHEVLDRWFYEMVLPLLEDGAILIRYADDAVLGFRSEKDARRVFATLPLRMAKYGLTLHPEKTRLFPFSPPRQGGPAERSPKRETFDFLGFTFHWRPALRSGRWMVQPRTARSRLRRALREIRDWCRRHRHDPVPDQHRTLCQKLRGHYGYYGISGNIDMLAAFRHQTTRCWNKWLRRRSQRSTLTWGVWAQFEARFPLPSPRITTRAFRSVSNL